MLPFLGNMLTFRRGNMRQPNRTKSTKNRPSNVDSKPLDHSLPVVPRCLHNVYPSSHHHGSVENGCISNMSFLSFRVIFHRTMTMGERVISKMPSIDDLFWCPVIWFATRIYGTCSKEKQKVWNFPWKKSLQKSALKMNLGVRFWLLLESSKKMFHKKNENRKKWWQYPTLKEFFSAFFPKTLKFWKRLFWGSKNICDSKGRQAFKVWMSTLSASTTCRFNQRKKLVETTTWMSQEVSKWLVSGL